MCFLNLYFSNLYFQDIHWTSTYIRSQTRPPGRELSSAEKALQDELVAQLPVLKDARDNADAVVKDLEAKLEEAKKIRAKAVEDLKAHRAKFLLLRS